MRLVLKGAKESPNPASDVWSLGALAWELFMGEPLFGAQYSDAQVKGALCGDLPLPFEQYRSLWNAVADVPVRTLLQQMLQVDPAARPSIGEVLNAPVFRAGMDTTMQRDLIDGLAKDMARLEHQLESMRELRLEAYAAQTVDALFMCIVFTELYDDDGAPLQPPLLSLADGGEGGAKVKGAADDAKSGVDSSVEDSDVETDFWSDAGGSDGGTEYLSVGTASVVDKPASVAPSASSKESLFTRFKSLVSTDGAWVGRALCVLWVIMMWPWCMV